MQLWGSNLRPFICTDTTLPTKLTLCERKDAVITNLRPFITTKLTVVRVQLSWSDKIKLCHDVDGVSSKARYTPNSKPSETVNFNNIHYGYIAKHCTCNQVFETVTHVEIILWDNFCSSCPTDSTWLLPYLYIIDVVQFLMVMNQYFLGVDWICLGSISKVSS